MKPYLDYFGDVVQDVTLNCVKAVTMDLSECRYCQGRQKCPGSEIPHRADCPVTVLPQVAAALNELPRLLCEAHGYTRKAFRRSSLSDSLDAAENAEMLLDEALGLLDVRPCESCGERPVWERWRNELLCSRCFEERSLDVTWDEQEPDV